VLAPLRPKPGLISWQSLSGSVPSTLLRFRTGLFVRVRRGESFSLSISRRSRPICSLCTWALMGTLISFASTCLLGLAPALLGLEQVIFPAARDVYKLGITSFAPSSGVISNVTSRKLASGSITGRAPVLNHKGKSLHSSWMARTISCGISSSEASSCVSPASESRVVKPFPSSTAAMAEACEGRIPNLAPADATRSSTPNVGERARRCGLLWRRSLVGDDGRRIGLPLRLGEDSGLIAEGHNGVEGCGRRMGLPPLRLGEDSALTGEAPNGVEGCGRRIGLPPLRLGEDPALIGEVKSGAECCGVLSPPRRCEACALLRVLCGERSIPAAVIPGFMATLPGCVARVPPITMALGDIIVTGCTVARPTAAAGNQRESLATAVVTTAGGKGRSR